jgi:predicted transcriptional regulator
MNMKIENTTKNVETGFSRAYAINEHTVQIVNAAIASGAVKWDGVADMIVDIHKALAATYNGLEASGKRMDALLASAAPVVASSETPVEVCTEATVVTAEVVVDLPMVETKVVETVAEKSKARPKRKIKSRFRNVWDAVTHEALYCLIDGVAKKELKRYLRTKHGLTWDEYRVMFDLPDDYPHVCKAASDRWSASAKRQGLGRTVSKVPKALRDDVPATGELQTVNDDQAVVAELLTPTSTRIVRGRTRARTVSPAGQIAA